MKEVRLIGGLLPTLRLKENSLQIISPCWKSGLVQPVRSHAHQTLIVSDIEKWKSPKAPSPLFSAKSAVMGHVPGTALYCDVDEFEEVSRS